MKIPKNCQFCGMESLDMVFPMDFGLGGIAKGVKLRHGAKMAQTLAQSVKM